MNLDSESARRILEGTLTNISDDAPGEPVDGAERSRANVPTDFRAGAVQCDTDDQPAIDWIADYRLKRRLGVGGLGTVFLAEQEHPRRDVAVKIVRPELSSSRTRGRLLQEAEFLARVQHPGIAQIYEAGIASTPYGDQAYIAMEYVAGKPVTEYVNEHGLTMTERIRLFLGICDAVAHAHRMGVIHRDLKPTNIITTGEGNTKILDFGLARALSHDAQHTSLLTGVGEVIGTLPYMSPEQLSGDPYKISTHTDIYSLSVILYCLLSDRLPFDVARLDFPKAARIIIENEPVLLGTLNPQLRGDVEVITAKAMSKEQDRRYASVSEFADDLRRYLNGEPVFAKPSSLSYRLGKQIKRNKGLAVGIVLAFGALVFGVAGMAWKTVEADRARERALVEADKAVTNEAMAREVASFLMEVLAAPGYGRQGPDVRVVEVLNAAAQRLAESPPNSLKVQAGMHLALGNGYQGVGDFGTAARHFEQALALTRENGEASVFEILELMKQLGGVLNEAGQIEDALRVLEEAERKSMKSLGVRDPMTARIRYARASVIKEIGRLAESREITSQSYDVLLQTLGPENELTRNVAIGLAYLCLELRDLSRAESILRDVIASYNDKTNPMLSEAQSVLGEVLLLQGGLSEAEAILREALAYRQKRFGIDHPHTCSTMLRLGQVLQASGRCAEAIAMTDEARRYRAVALGLQNHFYYRAVIAQFLCLTACDDEAGALTLLETGWADARQHLGHDHDVTHRLGGLLVDVYAARGNRVALLSTARVLFPANRMLPDRFGTEGPVTWLRCARAMIENGEIAQADALYSKFCIIGAALPDLAKQADDEIKSLLMEVGRSLTDFYENSGRIKDAERIASLQSTLAW